MVVLEAMAFELPIISTNVYGIPEIIDRGLDGILVEPGQPSSMADSIQRFLTDSESGSRMARHAWHSVQRKFDQVRLLSLQARLFREAVICHEGNSK